jgi:3-oxoacyl-[acyl-carrier protein] reductase
LTRSKNFSKSRSINLSSIAGSHPVAGALLLYASTKGAIETLTRGLALELPPRKIRVNGIAPGHTETESNVAAGTFEGGAGAVLAGKTPLCRLGRITDITPLAVFLASDESAWITGEVIRAAIDSGNLSADQPMPTSLHLRRAKACPKTGSIRGL